MCRARDELVSLQQLANQHGVAVDGAAMEALLSRVPAEPRSHMTAPASPATCAAAEAAAAIPSPTSSTYTGPLYTGACHRARSEETSGGGAGVSSAGLSAMLAGVSSGSGATASSVGGGGGVDAVMMQLQEMPCSRASPPPRTLLSSP